MPNFPRFASPVARDRRSYYRAIVEWFHNGSGPRPERPEDPLQPFRDATERRRKRLISMRVDEDLLDLTKELARQHGLRYQVVFRLWIQEGLRRAIREGVEDPERCPFP